MKRVFALVWLSFVFCGVLITSARGEPSPGPSMLLPMTSFNFKEVQEGDILTHTFKVLNKGKQPLEIRNVNPG